MTYVKREDSLKPEDFNLLYYEKIKNLIIKIYLFYL